MEGNDGGKTESSGRELGYQGINPSPRLGQSSRPQYRSEKPTGRDKINHLGLGQKPSRKSRVRKTGGKC
jgi:hypothetical protein